MRSRKRWDRAAETEPYYSVLSQPRFLLSRIQENPVPFFESGEADVEKLIASIRAIDRDARLHNVLEYGCGPGRLIPAFLRRGLAVTAVDLSPRMLTLAAKNTDASVVFVEQDEFHEDESSRFDLVNVARVMQHIPAADAEARVHLLARRVRRGGYLYLDFPFRSTRSTLSRVALSLRAQIPALNSLANTAKQRPRNTPVSPVHVHSLDTIVAALQDSAMEIVDITITSENELTMASILARAVGVKSVAQGEVAAPLEVMALPADYISPADLIRTITLEDLSVRAEQYFARMDSFDAQLAKPFASPTESPVMLISLGAILHGMRLAPGMTVLDFGGGTGWLSRALLQMGCRPILSDVSSTALRIARESIASDDAQYLLFNGTTIDLPDASIDRVVCFDSFHHIPNPDAILREFARVLKPGGLAAFSEPGPEHSRSAQSQFEMRVHGVLENDVDVNRIFAVAKDSGFDDFRLAIFDGTPVYVPLDEFEDAMREGAALRRAARHMRDFTANVRTFVMHKRGEETLDSRTTRGLLSRVSVSLPATFSAGAEIPFTATVENIGTSLWLPSAVSVGGVSLGAHLYWNEQLLNFDFAWLPLLSEPLAPGAQVTVSRSLPALSEGHYAIEFDCVANHVTWFAQAGSTPTRRSLDVTT
ncbi:MAG TPA: methyltransferase domain-containing protein [Thermoanaerobaculia bacterium]|jgi:SAM-dependent methyltransferase|nr:methyltransferase domain-containing protein [Thermoanaerobaculia bacterium]